MVRNDSADIAQIWCGKEYLAKRFPQFSVGEPQLYRDVNADQECREFPFGEQGVKGHPHPCCAPVGFSLAWCRRTPCCMKSLRTSFKLGFDVMPSCPSVGDCKPGWDRSCCI